MEQLQGIVDSNDPCQNPIAGLPISTVPPLSNVSLPSVLPAPDPVTNFLTTYKTPLMIGGGLFAGILLLKALR